MSKLVCTGLHEVDLNLIEYFLIDELSKNGMELVKVPFGWSLWE